MCHTAVAGLTVNRNRAGSGLGQGRPLGQWGWGGWGGAWGNRGSSHPTQLTAARQKLGPVFPDSDLPQEKLTLPGH